jgi:hypothetical protein
MHISEAYATLSHTEKRARYDRDVMRHLNPRYHHHPAKGSYHSTGPAGGRPASGLSRRRGTYQGPPPSFYRSGGWGAHGTKRRAAHEESTGMGAGYGTNSHSHRNQQSPGADHPPPPPGSGAAGGAAGGFNPSGGAGGMGPGQDPFGHQGDVPHFDREAHLRAQKRSDDRRAHKIARDRGVNIDQPDSATTVSFFGLAAILGIIVMGPLLLSNMRSKGNSGSSSSNSSGAGADKERERKAR